MHCTFEFLWYRKEKDTDLSGMVSFLQRFDVNALIVITESVCPAACFHRWDMFKRLQQGKLLSLLNLKEFLSINIFRFVYCKYQCLHLANKCKFSSQFCCICMLMIILKFLQLFFTISLTWEWDWAILPCTWGLVVGATPVGLMDHTVWKIKPALAA